MARTEEFGVVLRRLRMAAGKTQAQVAKAAKVSHVYVSQLECGERRAPSNRGLVRRLAHAVGDDGALLRAAARVHCPVCSKKGEDDD